MDNVADKINRRGSGFRWPYIMLRITFSHSSKGFRYSYESWIMLRIKFGGVDKVLDAWLMSSINFRLMNYHMDGSYKCGYSVDHASKKIRGADNIKDNI